MTPPAAVFDYPSTTHIRRHGPQGYLDYKHYKPWLRDEFSFRCVYCLGRETWLPDGQAYFGIDHVRPRRQVPEGPSTYDDLVYACGVCTAWKRDFPEALDFSSLAVAEHLEAQPDGTIRALTARGQVLIDVCALNRPDLVAFRRDLRMLLLLLAKRRGEAAAQLLKRYLGYPDDLPFFPKESRIRQASLRSRSLSSSVQGRSSYSSPMRRSYSANGRRTNSSRVCGFTTRRGVVSCPKARTCS